MRHALIGALTVCSAALALSADAAPKPDKALLGVRILDTYKAVLAKYGQPTRVEAGPLASSAIGPTTSVGGSSAPPMMGGMMGMPGAPMMGALTGPGAAPRGPMVGGMGMIGGPPRGASGPMGAMGAMSSAGGAAMGMMGSPPRGAMGGTTSGGAGLPGLGGMGMAGGSSRGMTMPGMGGGLTAPRSSGGMSSGMSMPGMPGMPGGMSMPGMPGMRGGMSMPGMPGGMLGAPMVGGMSSGRAGGTGGQTYPGASVETGAGEVAWIYEKGTDTQVFLFNNDGRVIQIQSFGYKAGARTINGVGLGDKAAKIYSIYGFPEETIVSGSTRTLDYSKRAHVAFQLADRRDGKGLRVVGITVGLTKAPDPENPD